MNTTIEREPAKFVSSGQMAKLLCVDKRTFNRKIEAAKIHPDAFLDDGAHRVALFEASRFQQLAEISHQ